ncbi:hypothetical protein [Shewanella glacialipiscicola]|uniref:hypothetical protein n=1 Tax=Shewanella glacialipiscicola TaxID=614069 RepID=UPI003D7A3085
MSLYMEDFTLEMIIAQAKAAQLKKETDAEKLPALFDKTLDALVSACEKLEAITAERDQLAAQVEILKSHILKIDSEVQECVFDDSHGFFIDSDFVSDASEAAELTPSQCLADIRAKAIESIDPVNFVSIALRHTTVCGDFDYQDVKDAFNYLAAEHRQAAKGGE